MFENKFNSKKVDPLVEAAKSAMELGQLRRDAIAAVNEEFGVYSRNAVVREQLAAYDAAVEEAYKCMKEGGQIDEISKDLKKRYLRKATDDMANAAHDIGARSKSKHPMDIEAGEDDKKRYTKRLKGTRRAIRSMEEGNDGNLANNYPPYDKVTRGDVIAGRLGKDQMGGKRKVDEKKMWEGSMDSDVVGGGAVTKNNKPVVSSTAPKADTSGPSAADKAGLASKIQAMKEAVKKEYDDKDQSEHGVYKGKKKLGYVVHDKKSGTHTAYHGPSDDGDHENVDDFPSKRKAVKQVKQSANLYKNMKEEALDEAKYSAKAARAGEDIGKPGKSFKMIAKKAGKHYGSEKSGERVAGAILAKIRAKHMKEENLEELSQFGSAFAAARKGGQSSFSYGGKSYTTQMKGAPSSAAIPAAPKATGDVGYQSGRTVSLKPIADTGTAQAAPSATPAPRPAPTPGWKEPAAVDQSKTIEKSGGEAPAAVKAPANVPTPPSRPAELSMPKIDTGPKLNPNKPGLQESVQVGTNKYRIV